MSTRPDNLHTVYMSGHPLGVECVCGRRVLLTHAQLGGCKGDMTELRILQKRLKCQAPGCGKRPSVLKVFLTAEEARAFELETDRSGPRF